MINNFWSVLKQEAQQLVEQEPLLASYVHTCILTHHNVETALSFILSNKIKDEVMPAIAIRELFNQAYLLSPQLVEAAISDVRAVLKRDPAITNNLSVMLNLKGFQAIQTHRLAHYQWQKNRKDLALFLQSRCSEAFGVDIHPAAKIGQGVMLDHATGVVIGETAVVEDNVSILQSVTLGGTGNETGDRHPKVRQGVMIGAGAKILGNIEIGEGAKIGAGSVVLKDVPAHVTVAGVPAKIVGVPSCPSPCETMNQNIFDD